MKKTQYTATYRKGRFVVSNDQGVWMDTDVPSKARRRKWFRQARHAFPGLTILK